MNTRAEALEFLYQRNKITKKGLKKAVVDGVITVNEYEIITKEKYK